MERELLSPLDGLRGLYAERHRLTFRLVVPVANFESDNSQILLDLLVDGAFQLPDRVIQVISRRSHERHSPLWEYLENQGWIVARTRILHGSLVLDGPPIDDPSLIIVFTQNLHPEEMEIVQKLLSRPQECSFLIL